MRSETELPGKGHNLVDLGNPELLADIVFFQLISVASTVNIKLARRRWAIGAIANVCKHEIMCFEVGTF